MARLSQCNAESFYRGEAGRKYFSRFPSPRSDILSRCFTAKVGRWIVPEDRVFEYGVGSGRNLLSLAVAVVASLRLALKSAPRAASLRSPQEGDHTVAPADGALIVKEAIRAKGE